MTDTPDPSAPASAAVYSRRTLRAYDLFALGFANTFVWRCPSRLILDFYSEHISANHLDVGVGTGYFLDRCQFPSSNPRIVLADLNQNCLEMASHRLARYRPASHLANVMEPLHIDGPGFDSIGLGYLLQCVPGPMTGKRVVFDNLGQLLNEDGVVFGSTILGAGVKQNLFARALTKVYNSRGIFSNTTDTQSGLEAVLQGSFRDFSIHVEGCVALFLGKS